MVGPVRFELTTSAPPARRATRLRYGPNHERAHAIGWRMKNNLFCRNPKLIDLKDNRSEIIRLMISCFMRSARLMEASDNLSS